LTTPPYSGFYLSRDTVAQLARAQNIPRGFGDRTQMLTNLLRGAAQFDALPALVDDLQTVLTTWQDAYTDYAASMPTLAPFAAVWQERISQTGRMLSQIDQQLEALA
jgi:hypothetical protein